MNDLDNVIFEVINQPTAESTAWQLHVAELIRQETGQQAKTHLVGASAFNSDELAALTADLFDFVAPQGGAMDATITVQGTSKVVQLDWSHLQQTDAPSAWVWKMATRGYAPALLFAAPGVQEDGAPNDSRLELAAGFGFFNQLMRRMQANQMAPAPAVCSTGYCLVDDRDAVAAYLVYLPEGGAVTIDLTGNSGQFTAEWISPQSGKTVHLETVDAGLPRNLTAPFEGDALVYLHRALNFGQWVFMPTLGAGEYASLAGSMPAEAKVTDRLFLPVLEAHP
ncbi:MAG: hypothetical protein IPK16_26885 [Anaerolineales bacterium]|nr:hypothetical protein [Anaerolineales bacterium]